MYQLTPDQLKAADRIYRWYDAGIGFEPQPLTVVRVNRKTVTVRTDSGNVFRMSPHQIVGYWHEDDPTFIP